MEMRRNGFGFGLGLLVLGGTAGSIYYVNQSDEPSENKSSAVNGAVNTTKTDLCGPDCDHAHSARHKSVAKRVAVKGADSMFSAKPGDTIELDFGADLAIRGRVSVNKEVAEGRRAVSMNLLGQKGTVYWLEYERGNVMGSVVLTKGGENQVYKFTSEQGQWLLQEVAFQDYVCSSSAKGEDMGMPSDGAPFTPAGVSAIVPLLNSRPSAEACVYIDFDGETVSGTSWVNGGTIVAEESGHTEAQIRQIWEETSEDMKPFDLNVTTDRSVFDATAVNLRMHVIVTPTKDAAPSAGGVAYLNSFYNGSIDPCWCFNLGLGSAAMTISHEVGHTFGLRHDGNTAQVGEETYHKGNGTWGPIMGAPFGLSVVSWSEGNYLNNTNTEDDLAIITTDTGFGYRDDDYGDSNGAGFNLSENTGATAVAVLGVIETTDDVDVFSFTTSGGAALLTATPTAVLHNMNIRVRLFDDAGNVVSESDPLGLYSASVSTTLDAGVYHFHVEGIADGSPDISGFNDYGSLGAYGITGNVAGLGGLIIDIVEPDLDDVSILEGNGLVLRASVVGEPDSSEWSVVSGPLGGVGRFFPSDTLATRATFSQPGLYILRYRGTKDGLASDATMRVSVEALGDVQLFSNRGPTISITSPEEFYSREGLLNGRAQDDGIPVAAAPAIEWVVVSGTATIENPLAVSPLIKFQDGEPNEVALESSDGQIRTFKQVTVLSVYEAREVVPGGVTARWFIPRDDTLGMTWTAPAFDDSLWATGTTGFGFNSNAVDYNQFLAEGTDVKSAMKSKSSSAFMRIPFTVPSLDYVQGLKLNINYNDAFVMYLNGVEVARKNTVAGPLVWNSMALTSRSLADVMVEDEIDLSPGLPNLVLGENILAIHGLNKSKKNSTFLIFPVLQADIVAAPYLSFMELYGFGLDPNGNEDGDGLLNFVEHALGTNPNEFNVAEPLVLQADGSMRITLPVDMPQDVDYVIEKSVDMNNWAPIASKRGKSAWTGESILVSVAETVGDQITFDIRQVTALPSSYYRLAYTLRGPILNP